MARPTEWRRTHESFVGGSQTTSHSTRMVPVNAGETVTRVRLHLQCSAFPDVPLSPWANELVMGVWLQNNNSEFPDLDLWADQGSEDWMWWEGMSWQQQLGAFRTNDQDPTEVITAPASDGLYDIRSQRICTSNGYLWLSTGGDPAGGLQTSHWLNYSASVLIILPPGT